VSSSDLGITGATTLERIEVVVRSMLNDDEIALRPETRAGEVTGWDSLAHITIVFALEDEFGIQFSDEDLASTRSVGELASCIDRARSA
jgi:acyl carrier protein